MYYIDTSVLAAYYCPEALSEEIQFFIREQRRPAISSLTEVELFSAVARKVRNGEISENDCKRILSIFVSHLENNLYMVIDVKRHHWELARGWIALFNAPLRTLDAVHLAVASSEGLILVTSDNSLQKCACLMGVETYEGFNATAR